MSTIVTEIAFVPLRTDAEIDDASSQDGKKWKSIVDSCVDMPGFIRGYIGRQIEDDTVITHLLDWESMESHEKFINHPSYKPMMADLETLQHGDGIFYHAHLRSVQNSEPTGLSHLFQSAVPPVTELQTFYFSPDLSSSDSSAFQKAFSTFYRDALDKTQGLMCVAGGWVVEELESKEIRGEKAKVFCIIEGWESVEKHTAFRDSEAYKAFRGSESLSKYSEVRGANLLAH